MPWIIPTAILMVISALMVAVIFFYLYHQYHEKYNKIWGFAAFGFALGPFLTLLTFSILPVNWGILGEEIVFFGACIFLLKGIYVFLNQAYPSWLNYGIILAGILSCLGLLIRFSFVIYSLPVYIFLGQLQAGSLLFRNWRLTGVGGKISGWAMIIAGLDMLEYPFIRTNQSVGALGYLLASVCIMTAAVGILLLYFQKIRLDLSQSETQYRFMAENARDIVYRLQIIPKLKYEFISAAVFEIIGYTPEEHYQDPNLIFKVIHPNYLKIMEQIVKGEYDYSKPVSLPWMHRDGHLIWIEQHIHPVTDSDGKIIALEGIARNITERIEMEEQLTFLSMKDPVTGLYNRTFFEQACRNFDAECYNPLGIILCDIDGLKLINDTLGHSAGDWLLLAAAWAIQESFRENDVIARIGGDEFAVLLPKTPSALVEMAVKRIEAAVQKYNDNGIGVHLSMSVGFACRDNSDVNMGDLFKNADNNMYREKLYRIQSVRSTIVNTLMKTLEARDFITEEHTERLQNIIVKLATAVGFPENRLTDLKLLVQFHDIGKVGIPDRILFKPGKLTLKEIQEMQRHSEIGYRIAQSAPDLVPIADWILKHHEWWNGNGYPLKLKGEEIPLECRILAIVDAFDAMTNDRPYRQALSWDKALHELKTASGKQFDPFLVEQFAGLVNPRERVISEIHK